MHSTFRISGSRRRRGSPRCFCIRTRQRRLSRSLCGAMRMGDIRICTNFTGPSQMSVVRGVWLRGRERVRMPLRRGAGGERSGPL